VLALEREVLQRVLAQVDDGVEVGFGGVLLGGLERGGGGGREEGGGKGGGRGHFGCDQRSHV
jgi:hypothetical protein